jgi:copper chaperone CopZ
MRNETPRTFVGTTTFRVAGLSCDRCELALIREVTGIDGVGTVTVDQASGVVTVTATTPVDRADITRAVQQAGFTLTG